MIKNNFDGGVSYTLSYIIDNSVVGFVKYEILYETVNIVDVFVESEYRNQGIATKMFEYLFKNTKCERFMLEVSEDNNVAIKLYERFGFKRIHIRKNYYKNRDAFIMEALR